jgi:hypothetical protein
LAQTTPHISSYKRQLVRIGYRRKIKSFAIQLIPKIGPKGQDYNQ